MNIVPNDSLRNKILTTASDVVSRLAEQLKSGKSNPWAERSFTQIEDGVEYEVWLKIKLKDPK